MTNHDTLTWVLAWTAGVLLGAVFFGSLWWTVRKSIASQRPALWLLGSLPLRMAMALAGIYFVADGHWERMLLCLLGFVMVRPIVTWSTRTAAAHPSSAAREASRAP